MEKRRAVRNLVQRHKPFLLFIQETKLNYFDYIIVKAPGGLVLTKGIGVEANGSAGGLITLWDEEMFTVKECISNERCIIVSGVLIKSSKEVIFCNMYESNHEDGRVELWNFILNAQASLPGIWVLGGDFNIVLDCSERIGCSMNARSMRNFRSFIYSVMVIDIAL